MNPAVAQMGVLADVKVRDLSPGSHGYNLVLRIVSVAPVVEKTRYDGSASRLAEAVLADETGCVTFTARNGEELMPRR